MRNFTLEFPSDTNGEAKTIAFESEDAHEAFSLLGRDATGRHVSLYEEDKLVAVITREADNRWQIEHQL